MTANGWDFESLKNTDQSNLCRIEGAIDYLVANDEEISYAAIGRFLNLSRQRVHQLDKKYGRKIKSLMIDKEVNDLEIKKGQIVKWIEMFKRRGIEINWVNLANEYNKENNTSIDGEAMYGRYSHCAAFVGREKNLKKLLDLDKIIGNKGGVLLSDSYTLSMNKYTVKCSKGHIWTPTHHNLFSANSWCPNCRTAKVWLAKKNTSKHLSDLVESTEI